MFKKLFLITLIASVALLGCTKKAKTNEVIKPQDNVVIVEEQPEQQLEVVEETTKVETNMNTQTITNEFKVQLFATYDEQKAMKVKDEAKTKFTEDVYIEFVAPYYKVRIGHYKTKEEADNMRDMAKEKGYSDAFTVVP